MILEESEAENSNPRLSSSLKAYQNSDQSASIFTALRQDGFTGVKIQNVIVPFDEDLPEMIRKNNLFMDAGGRKEVGIALRMIAGERIEIFVAFV